MISVNFDGEQILELLDKSQVTLLRFATEFIQDMNEHVVSNTPFLTGNLRGSWYAGLNSEPEAENGPPDPGGGAVARLNLAAADLKLGDVYYAINGANYAGFVEYGTSRMAPRLFVTTIVNSAGIYAEETAARLAGES